MPNTVPEELNMIKHNIELMSNDCLEAISSMKEHNELLSKLESAHAKLWNRIMTIQNNKEHCESNYGKTYEELSSDFASTKDKLNELSSINIKKIEELKAYINKILSLANFKRNAPVSLYSEIKDFYHKLLDLSLYPHIKGDFSEFMVNYEKSYSHMIEGFNEEIENYEQK